MGEIKETPKNDTSMVNSGDLEAREYQIKIASECANKNSMVVLPTGLGKTIIAVLVAKKILDVFPPQSKIIVLAPTRPLINQHLETFLKFLGVPEEKFAILTGKVLPQKRKDMFAEHQILFYTPQTLRNDLVNEKYTLETTALVIFDEAHHATGDYPYPMIADKFIDHNPDGIILGLTASPGASKKKITELCQSLHIPMKNIHIRTRKDEDVRTYVKPMDMYKIGVNLSSLMEEVYQVLIVVLEERLQYLSQLNFLEARGDALVSNVIRKDLLKLNSELVAILKNNGDKTGVYNALSINAQALMVYHTLELVEQQGLDVLLIYMEKLYKDAKKKNSSKATRILASDGRLRRVFLELKKNADFSPENLVHPKFEILVKVLLEELRNNSSARILVFVKLRSSVKNIVTKLKDIPLIEPVRFVGQATKSQEDKGLSQKQQIEILNQFKDGHYNVLVSTNVGEEGLDIAECDLVVFYDVVASEIRMIQRKGRTARHRKGKVVILYCKETHDEVYLKIVLSKLKRMNITLKNPRQLKESYKQLDDVPRIMEKAHEVNERITKNNLQSKKMNKRQHQSNLESFISGEALEKGNEDVEFDVKLSKYLPMKYGIRNKLQEDNILFEVVESDLHVVIFNKVLIQIYDPKRVNLDDLNSEVSDFKQISSLLIVIFDFIEFEEKIEGEKRLLKRKLQEFGKEHEFQTILIDNEEELHFIMKNILEHPR